MVRLRNNKRTSVPDVKDQLEEAAVMEVPVWEPAEDPVKEQTRKGARKQEVHLITGGGGYAGYHLGKRLASQGHRVILLDVRGPIWPHEEGMTFVQCDITRPSQVEAALEGVDCVYHMASYGMSGREQLYRSRIEAVNVGGTENIIRACQKHDITRLVYTSTYNVVFGGQVIENGDESLPYLPLHKHPDHYSETKSIAEQRVLAADGEKTDGNKVLHTCALRLAGVYGPGEQRHIPRIVDYIERGLFSVIYEQDTLQEFLHVDNLAQAHDLAAHGLKSENMYIATGQAYFISDQAPVNTFKFFQPLIEGLGYPMPHFQLPISVIYVFAFLTELVHWLVRRIYNFQPLLTRTEVYKTGVTHYFSNMKAQNELGYEPTVQNDISAVLQFYLDRGRKRSQLPKKESTFRYYLVNILLGCIFAVLVMSFIPIVK